MGIGPWWLGPHRGRCRHTVWFERRLCHADRGFLSINRKRVTIEPRQEGKCAIRSLDPLTNDRILLYNNYAAVVKYFRSPVTAQYARGLDEEPSLSRRNPARWCPARVHLCSFPDMTFSSLA